MTDAVLVFPPGFRVLDVNGDPVNGAKIKFNEPGPGAAKTVYSDADLSVSLGATVRTRSDGFPVVSFGSETTVLIYVGSDPYYIEITDANDVPIFPAKDNVQGAVDTSDFLTSAASLTLNIPVVSHTGAQTLDATHKGKCINANPNGGTFTETLSSAITLGDGWNVLIRHAGTSNNVRITASQTIAMPFGSVSSFALRPGEAVWIKSNGATFVATTMAPPRLTATIGIIEIVDRVNAEPVTPTAGARYISTGAFNVNTGTLAIASGDIIEATGLSTWFKVTPPTDCGWLAWVQSENRYYHFADSAWVLGLEPAASDTVPGIIELATQAEQETGTDVVRAVVPGRQHFHPSAAKAYIKFNGTGTPAIGDSFNVTSITDNGTGDYTINFTTAFSGTNYAAAGFVRGVDAARANMLTAESGDTKTTSAMQFKTRKDDGTAQDSTEVGILFFGDRP